MTREQLLERNKKHATTQAFGRKLLIDKRNSKLDMKGPKDGKRRIVALREGQVVVGHGTISVGPTKVIDDSDTIALVEESGIPFKVISKGRKPKAVAATG